MTGRVRRIAAVALREWRSTFVAPSGWIVMAIVGIVAAVAFFSGTFADARPATLRTVLLATASHQMHRRQLVIEPLEVQGDAHAVGGARAPVGIQPQSPAHHRTALRDLPLPSCAVDALAALSTP